MAVAAEASGAPFPETAAADLATERGRNPAFDGVRFVAVTAVLASHFGIPGCQAGFLGVDMFFVLSGFLITGILLGQVERGNVLLGHFWTRRVRRLAPALLLLLAVIIVWGAEFAPSTARDSLRGDITGTLLYVANWHFIAAAGSYFASALQEPSPLLHMWSLAVEEQFYVLWPAVLFLVAMFVRGRFRLPLIGGLAVAGLILSAVRLYTLWDPLNVRVDRAYMGTDSRMFEPLLGAALAVLLMWRPRLGSERIMNWTFVALGALLVAIGFGGLADHGGPSSWYPKGGALMFSVGAALIIWAVATRTSVASSVLAFPPIAYLGRISYGIYLWHWPLIVWVNTHQFGLGRLAGVPLAVRVYFLVFLTVALAALSYHFVEKPIRYGGVGKRLNGLRIAIALPLVLALLLAFNVTEVTAQPGATIQLPGTYAGAPPVNVTKTIVLVGDSVPGFFAPELADAAAKYGYTVISATSSGCPATAVEKVYSDGELVGGNCRQIAAKQDATIRKYHPALVLWWSRYEITHRLDASGRHVPLGSPAYEQMQKAAFNERTAALTRLGARVVAVQIEHPGKILAVHNPPERFILFGPIMLYEWGVVSAWNAFLASHHGPAVFSIEVNDIVCHAVLYENTCDDRLPDGQSARPVDGIHYSTAAGPVLAPVVIMRALIAAGLPPYRR